MDTRSIEPPRAGARKPAQWGALEGVGGVGVPWSLPEDDAKVQHFQTFCWANSTNNGRYFRQLFGNVKN